MRWVIYRWTCGTFAVTALIALGFLIGCKPKQADQKARTVEAAGGAVTDAMPHFDGKVGQLDNEGGFGDFLDKHSGQRVVLAVTIPDDEYQGGEEAKASYFVLYDECDEPFADGEKPTNSKCQGTQYHVPKVKGKPALTQDDDGEWHLDGVFRPSTRSGPQGGLFSVTLEPAS